MGGGLACWGLHRRDAVAEAWAPSQSCRTRASTLSSACALPSTLQPPPLLPLHHPLLACTLPALQAFADGPGLVLSFTVPPHLAHQHLAPAPGGPTINEQQQAEAAGGCAVALGPTPPGFPPFTEQLQPADADKWIWSQPTPMFAALNLP